jgi:hypothetical protein
MPKICRTDRMMAMIRMRCDAVRYSETGLSFVGLELWGEGLHVLRRTTAARATAEGAKSE